MNPVCGENPPHGLASRSHIGAYLCNESNCAANFFGILPQLRQGSLRGSLRMSWLRASFEADQAASPAQRKGRRNLVASAPMLRSHRWNNQLSAPEG
jgi:hypothetical protein